MITFTKACFFVVSFALFCVYQLYTFVNTVESDSSELSENGLLNAQAVLSLHHTIQLFMNLNKRSLCYSC